jgi:outer membrane translocation and assembly module TamA
VVIAARVLAGTGFGPDELLPVDRFFAGGGTTVRGYAENGLGPLYPDGTPSGGRSMLVVNQEARVSLGRWLGALAFVDAGNAFDRAQFSAPDLRVGYGIGLRVNSPIGLLRLDFGVPAAVPLNSTRRANQVGSGRYYLGFGHIF